MSLLLMPRNLTGVLSLRDLIAAPDAPREGDHAPQCDQRQRRAGPGIAGAAMAVRLLAVPWS